MAVKINAGPRRRLTFLVNSEGGGPVKNFPGSLKEKRFIKIREWPIQTAHNVVTSLLPGTPRLPMVVVVMAFSPRNNPQKLWPPQDWVIVRVLRRKKPPRIIRKVSI